MKNWMKKATKTMSGNYFADMERRKREAIARAKEQLKQTLEEDKIDEEKYLIKSQGGINNGEKR